MKSGLAKAEFYQKPLLCFPLIPLWKYVTIKAKDPQAGLLSGMGRDMPNRDDAASDACRRHAYAHADFPSHADYHYPSHADGEAHRSGNRRAVHNGDSKLWAEDNKPPEDHS